MAFQAAVATWFAVHILVRMPVGGRFGINNEAVPVAIRLETGEGLDDIDVSQSDGGTLQVQCKTTANLATAPDSPLAKTIRQLVRWVADATMVGAPLDRNRNVALLAVSAGAPRTLDNLESGCRAFDLGGTWSVTRAQRNQAERNALNALETIAIPAWTDHRRAAPTEHDLATLARVFHVARFTMDEGDSDWREASRLLGRGLFGREAAGDAPLRDLKAIMRSLISSGAPADRAGLLQALRSRGHQDVSSPDFDADIARLGAATRSELARLAVHGHLPLGHGVPIARESDAPLVDAIREGSLLVVGEPGAGKTGALVHAAATMAAAGDTVVFLSVDRFPGVAIAANLVSELGLTHSVVETLAAMPGAGRKILIIDALDAARGGTSEAVFATLIEDARERLANDWIVVASIRTFDLKNGRRFRDVFAGTPADHNFADAGLQTVRHFLVPRLTETDLAVVGASSSELGALLASAPPRLAELLRNVFNLSLAAQLLDQGADPAAFSAIRTQSGLIDVYEDARLNTTLLQQAAAATAAVMAQRRRLSVRKVTIGHSALDAVIQTGVLAESGDLVSFAHHVLFDHVTGRFRLDWDHPNALVAQLSGDTSTALLLAPALRFAIERRWRFDDENRTLSWQLITGIFSESTVDPVLGNVALRIAVENIEQDRDISGLTERITASPADPALVALTGRLARFAAMEIESTRPVSTPRAIAWARLADALLATGENRLVDPARVLLITLFQHGDLSDAALLEVYGRAARALLEFAWSTSPSLTAISTNAIRFVGKSFASDPATSRTLLDRILREPHFSQYADCEASWLAEQILPITRVDPDFTVQIYAALYSQTIDDDSTSWIGGYRSRIMPLSSNRKQDYEHCRWHLGIAMGDVLAISPAHGTRALIEALIGKAASSRYGRNHEPTLVSLGSVTIEMRGHDTELNAWYEEEDNGRNHDDDLLYQYVRFLRGGDIAAFRSSVTSASRDYATASVWSRILGVGAERVGECDDLLWPLVEQPDFFENGSTIHAAARFVAAAWPSRTHEARVRFETMILDETRLVDEHDRRRWRYSLSRILALVPENTLELEGTRVLRRALDAERLLVPNEPDHLYTRDLGDHGIFVRSELRRNGIDIDSGPNGEVLDASDALNAHVSHTPSDSPTTDLATLWSATVAFLALVDSNPGLHDQVQRSSIGHVANAVERIASSPNYAPGEEGLPDLPTMFALLERLSSSRFPVSREVDA
ncbi:RecA/RadA recombinase [Paraburkholderia sp. HC6.4b]|uniref:hypothetical protein n=1 Tax=unclassified Paraburkholderia TaxID=2615204 RepID=UPI0017F59B70|nr:MULTISPECIES: hypothetical protein [unclassified Paraburkholderia]MBB5412149.1 RecA/RadA recombinase [Paraburkholderia sp. HC6.4b]MBB5454216.1 RecA/RadA recombinase [Paraburkholderia sp. Kb1A]